MYCILVHTYCKMNIVMKIGCRIYDFKLFSKVYYLLRLNLNKDTFDGRSLTLYIYNKAGILKLYMRYLLKMFICWFLQILL